MNQTWKAIIVLLVSSSLMACSTSSKPTPPTTKHPDNEAQAGDKKPQYGHVVPSIDHQKTPPEMAAKPKPKKKVVKAKHTKDGKTILGTKEWVHVPGLDSNFRARVDTGADTSSISALDIIAFERDGKDWVKFTVVHDSVKSQEMALPVERWVKGRQANSEQDEKRPVVISWVELGDIREKTEFTLTDRTHMEFPVILGRNFFKDIAIVDVSQEYVQGEK